MSGLIVYESELRKISNCSYKWNSNGFVMLEFDGRGSHFRLDLERQDGHARVYSGGDYKLIVNSIHLKDHISTTEDGDTTKWLYYYVAYEGAGVWNWSKDYMKTEDNRARTFKNSKAAKDDVDNGHQALTWLLGELGRVTNTTQGLGIEK